jgi:hypothetical protein
MENDAPAVGPDAITVNSKVLNLWFSIWTRRERSAPPYPDSRMMKTLCLDGGDILSCRPLGFLQPAF